MAYAHTPNSAGEWHTLVDHLRSVASLAASFAIRLQAERLGYYVGLWHDLGKHHPDFQSYLARCASDAHVQIRGPDHKAAGAALAVRHAEPLALLIQGHHGGLQTPSLLRGWLEELGEDARRLSIEEARKTLGPQLEPDEPLTLPTWIKDRRSAEMFLRLLFSSLIDADHLDTERHFRPEYSVHRGSAVSLSALAKGLDEQERTFKRNHEGPVNQVRKDVYSACVEAAEGPPGMYRLAAPTGGGKTLSGMAFALRHAVRHGLERVVVAVPFISITEQTASVYRSVFERDEEQAVVLEHHSGARFTEDDGEDFRERYTWARLASDNWDAPIIVTTTVQLFESLFSNRPSRCRKIHRLARSVIVLDEAQALPPGLLRPILDGLTELSRHYRTTVVISTATQPAFEVIEEFARLPAADIVPDRARLFKDLKRVTYEWNTTEALEWRQIAARMRGHRQALAIVNTKRDALALLDALGDPDELHLSTLLCGAHRRDVIAEVKRRLQANEACRLVSTQVVEAGVDIDFPVVMRAFGPIDSIVQAAGRCNREGRLDSGQVFVFEPADGGMPSGWYKAASEISRALLNRPDVTPDDPSIAATYFRQLYETIETDREGIQPLRESFDYPEVARRFRMIDDDTEGVVITGYGSQEERREVRGIVERLRSGAPEARWLRRKLEPYVVSVRSRQVQRYIQEGRASPIIPGLYEWLDAYHDTRGIATTGIDAESLVV